MPKAVSPTSNGLYVFRYSRKRKTGNLRSQTSWGDGRELQICIRDEGGITLRSTSPSNDRIIYEAVMGKRVERCVQLPSLKQSSLRLSCIMHCLILAWLSEVFNYAHSLTLIYSAIISKTNYGIDNNLHCLWRVRKISQSDY